MLMLDATGYGHGLYAKMGRCVADFMDVECEDHILTVNKTAGNGVLTSLRQILDLNGHNVVEIRTPYLDDALDIQLLSNNGVIVIDDAQDMDHCPETARKLVDMAGPECKLIYVVTVSKRGGVQEV